MQKKPHFVGNTCENCVLHFERQMLLQLTHSLPLTWRLFPLKRRKLRM
jgi:hypothetical protein